MEPWPNAVNTVSLFVEDLAAAKAFYQDVFGLGVVFEDPESVLFRIGALQVNLLAIGAAPELIGPAVVAPRDAGVRMQFTINVEDVDALAGRLVAHGVTLINGPIDRPWGVRTACFSDPAGHNWEIAAEIRR
jgi:catechol 2,3-dioxygenase-like lactoylglutathione lyase family enzyme